jgi:hypothetical protein
MEGLHTEARRVHAEARRARRGEVHTEARRARRGGTRRVGEQGGLESREARRAGRYGEQGGTESREVRRAGRHGGKEAVMLSFVWE